jgi:nucleoside-diphosphate-sugar epimerase
VISKNIIVTGSNGFVGTNVLKHNSISTKFHSLDRANYSNLPDNDFYGVVHLAGIAHDLKKVSKPQDYFTINTDLTIDIFNSFLNSNVKVFIMFSSVKAVADSSNSFLFEDSVASPITHYGKSKLLAEQYILSKDIPEGKRVYILRPCMIHGPGNKGNLNLLYKLVSQGIPWPLGAFENKRSFCSIDNLMFIINELIEREDIASGVYNISDDEALSTNDLISILAESQNRKANIWKVYKGLIQSLAKLGDVLRLPLTTERLQKLTESYVVSNQKIKNAIGKPLPVSSKEGLLKTFKSFN